MKRFMQVAGTLVTSILLLGVLLSLFGCSPGNVKPDPLPVLPETVTVVVEKPKLLPPELTDPLPRHQKANGTIGAAKVHEAVQDAILDLADCHRVLAARISRGEKVDLSTCRNPVLDSEPATP